MRSPEFSLQKKSDKELESQLRDTNKKLGNERNFSLLPPSSNENEILSMSLDEIKNKFPERYRIYVRLLREAHAVPRVAMADINKNTISELEIEHMKKWLTALNSLDQYIKNHEEGNGESVLRERQLTVFGDLRKFLEQGGKDGYLKLPTGFGKTVLFTEFIEALDLKTLIVVPTTPLVGQTEKKLEEFAPNLDVGKIYSKAKQYGRKVTIITYDSLVSQINNGILNPTSYECLILDEAHIALGPTRIAAVSKFTKAIRLGFTATPDYAKKSVGEILPTEIHRMDIREAVEEGLLSSFSSIIARTEANLSNVKITSSGEYNEEELENAVNIESRNKAAVQLYLQAFNGQRGISYCAGVKHAKEMTRLFNAAGVPAAFIGGETPDQEAEKIIRKFSAGKIKMICNSDILITGFDEPQANTCFNLRPTRSRVVAEQRGGRVLRLDSNNTYKHAHVVDFLDKGVEKKLPVLFADVAKSARVVKKEEPQMKKSTILTQPPVRFPKVSIEGLEIIVDTEEIMRIVHDSKEMSLSKEILTYVQLKEEVQKTGIRSKEQYSKEYKKYKNWPSSPPYSFPDEWQSWAGFLGKETKKFLNFSDLKADVLAAGIKSSEEYERSYKNHTGWPAEPQQIYKKLWKDWFDFLGKEKPTFLSFGVFQDQVRRAGIHSYTHYMEEYANHIGWPSEPQVTYRREWKSWDTLLNREFLSFQDLKKAIQSAGVTTMQQYKIEQKKHPGWPASPWTMYKQEWKGQPDFFGREKIEFLSYEQIRKEINRLKPGTQREYLAMCNSRPNWPRAPYKVYWEYWAGWPLFLGKE